VTRKLLPVFLTSVLVAASAIAHARVGTAPFIWEADTTLGGIADKNKINAYLDNLKAHSVNGVWVQVELYSDGTVNYKKTLLSGLPTAEKFKTGQWADDDFLSYVIHQARSRGMSVMIKFHGGNDPAWDKNPDWRMRDSRGKEVLWGGRLKSFCVNSPYWDKIFFPMLKEIGANYDVDGFYLDTCQAAYLNDNTCFCVNCRARFEKETGEKLPMKSVDKANWSDFAVKLHAVKRVEWLNKFYEKYGKAVEEAKKGAASILNVSGGYNSYADGISSRHAAKYVTHVTPEPVNTPRMYAVVRNRERRKAGQEPADEMGLAKEQLYWYMTRFGYLEFVVKTMLGDGAGKPVIPFARYWFTSKEDGYTGPVDLEIAQIESAIGAGAKGYCFFGYLGAALARGEVAGTAWDDPKFIEYLKDLAAGERAEWIADMEPGFRIAILYDRDAPFWDRNYWQHLKSVAGTYALMQYWKKLSVDLVAASEPNMPGFGETGYRLDANVLKGYDLIVAPGLDYVNKEDLEALKAYTTSGGHLLIMGGIGGHGKFLGESLSDVAYELLGITTIGDPTPSGFMRQVSKHPVFTGVTPTALLGTFRLAPDKNAALSCEPKYGEGWEVLAHEITDTGKRPAILLKQTPDGSIGYINSAMSSGFSSDMMLVFANMLVITATRGSTVQPVQFSSTSSVNVFKSSDGLTRYIHIFTLDGETDVSLRIRGEGLYPVSAQIIRGGGRAKDLDIAVAKSGNAIIELPEIKPYFAMIKMRYEDRQEE